MVAGNLRGMTDGQITGQSTRHIYIIPPVPFVLGNKVASYCLVPVCLPFARVSQLVTESIHCSHVLLDMEKKLLCDSCSQRISYYYRRRLMMMILSCKEHCWQIY